jgi:AmiR/NasT family two-component response regulator
MKPARILITEDEAITVSALRRELTEMGYEIAGTAMSAQEAVFAAEEKKPDLVLMDITLADEYDGVIAATAIRGNLGVPVVFLTAHVDDATMQRAVQAGPFGYVVKPFTTPELKAAIEVALHKHRSEADDRTRLKAGE